MSKLIDFVVTIDSGEALSNAINVDGMSVLGVRTEGSWTAAGIGFKTAPTEGGTYKEATDSTDALLEIAVADLANASYSLNPNASLGWSWVKVWSQTGGVNVNQGADRTLVLTCRKFE